MSLPHFIRAGGVAILKSLCKFLGFAEDCHLSGPLLDRRASTCRVEEVYNMQSWQVKAILAVTIPSPPLSQATFAKFEKLYELQSWEVAFETPEEFLKALGLYEETQLSFDAYMEVLALRFLKNLGYPIKVFVINLSFPCIFLLPTSLRP